MVPYSAALMLPEGTKACGKGVIAAATSIIITPLPKAELPTIRPLSIKNMLLYFFNI